MTAEIKWFTIPEVNLMAETGDSQTGTLATRIQT